VKAVWEVWGLKQGIILLNRPTAKAVRWLIDATSYTPVEVTLTANHAGGVEWPRMKMFRRSLAGSATSNATALLQQIALSLFVWGLQPETCWRASCARHARNVYRSEVRCHGRALFTANKNSKCRFLTRVIRVSRQFVERQQHTKQSQRIA